MGSSVGGIVILLSMQFIRWVLLANIIAISFSYFFMQKWLEEFVYKIDISPLVFVISGSAALVVSVITVGYQTVNAALSNPVDAIKYE